MHSVTLLSDDDEDYDILPSTDKEDGTTSQLLPPSPPPPPSLIIIIIIIMYIWHALINALSTHMIYINLNMIFYSHVEEHSPTKSIYIKYYLKNKNKNK